VAYSVFKALQMRGLGSTLAMIRVALADKAADKALGLLAHDFLDPRLSDPLAPNVEHANYYQPVRTIPFRTLMKELKPDPCIGFVDVGAGTGKAMLLAAEYGFRSVRGVELAASLCEDAKKNFAKFAGKHPHAKLEISQGDALAFPLREHDRFFFLNDPFSEEVFAPFIERLREHRRSAQGELTLVYKNNNLRNIPSLKALRKTAEFSCRDYSGNFFEIYRF